MEASVSDVALTPLAYGTKLTLKAGCVLIDDGGVRILVDPGHFGSRVELAAAMEALAGCALEDVDVLFFTHLHFDHYADLGFAEVPRVAVPEKEFQFFGAAAELKHDPEAFLDFIRSNHEHIAPIFLRHFQRLAHDRRYNFETVSFRDRLELVRPGELLSPRVRVIDLPGHSPGHCGLELYTRWGRTVIAGDAVLSLEDSRATDASHHLIAYRFDKLVQSRERLKLFDFIIPGHGTWFSPRTGPVAK